MPRSSKRAPRPECRRSHAPPPPPPLRPPKTECLGSKTPSKIRLGNYENKNVLYLLATFADFTRDPSACYHLFAAPLAAVVAGCEHSFSKTAARPPARGQECCRRRSNTPPAGAAFPNGSPIRAVCSAQRGGFQALSSMRSKSARSCP